LWQGEIGAKSYMKGDYEEFCDLSRRKNKANLLAFNVLRSACCVKMRKGNLKKQSQFAPAQVCAKSFIKGNYDNKAAVGDEKTKPNKANFCTGSPFHRL